MGSGSTTSLDIASAQAIDASFTIGSDANQIVHAENQDASGGEANIGNRLLTGVADGRVTATSSDGVNGSQLHAVNTQVGTNATNIETNVTNIANNANNINRNSRGIVNNTGDIRVNRRNIAVNRGDIDINRQNIGINRNAIAVNAAGIATNANGIELNSQTISNVNGDLQSFKRTARAGIAGASAFVDPGDDTIGTSFAVGLASYEGEQAVSANIGYTPKNKRKLNLFAGVSATSEGSNIYRAGLRYQWRDVDRNESFRDRREHREVGSLKESVADYQQQLVATAQELGTQKQVIASQSDEIAVLKAQNQEILRHIKKLSSVVATESKSNKVANSVDSETREPHVAKILKSSWKFQ